MRSLIWLLGIWAVLGVAQAKPMSLEELDKIETEIDSSNSGSSISVISPVLPEEDVSSGNSVLVEDEDSSSSSSSSSSSIEERQKRSIPDPDRISNPYWDKVGHEDHPDHVAHEQHRWARSATETQAGNQKPDASSGSSEEEPQGEKAKNKANSSGENSSSSEEQQTIKNIPEEETTENALRRKREASFILKEHPASSEQLESTETGDIDTDMDTDIVQSAAADEIHSDKDKTSLEDYAQGCEVLEMSSKEANEATYLE